MDNRPREIWIDWMRVIACFMVMVVHSTEPFYLGGDGSLILTKSDAFWAAISDSIVRACVPLFLVASSYLQFPLRYSTGEFFKRRAVRILIPFIIWSIVYALIWGKPVENLKDLAFNFNYAAGHLWFVYMLVGIYILMPLLSPWAEKVGKRELQVYLGIWLLTTIIPLLKDWLATGPAPLAYGPTGIPNPARYPLWGEASWNVYGTFYYISGMIGYMLLGLYFRRFPPKWSRGKNAAVGIAILVAGFGIVCGGFLRRVFADGGGVFPVAGDVSLAVHWETTWGYDTIGTALMTIGCIMLFRMIRSEGGFYHKVLLPLSKAGYGMYLCHMVLLSIVSAWIRSSLGIGADGTLGLWTTPVQILITALLTFAGVATFSVLVQRIPKIGKYIIG